MRFLMLLSALLAWARTRKGGKPVPTEKKRELRFLKQGAGATVRILACPDLHLSHHIPQGKAEAACRGGDCPLCDGGHERLVGGEMFPLHDRRPEKDSPYQHGWYSVDNDRAHGHHFCKTEDGRVVKVTNATKGPTGGLSGWPDAVYAGKLASPSPVPPPLPMTEERARFVAAILERALSGRNVTCSHAVAGWPTETRCGPVRQVTVVPVGKGWQIHVSLGGCVWFIDDRVGVHWGEDGPELWSETETGSGLAVRDVFAPVSGYIDHADWNFWRDAKQALWTGRYFTVRSRHVA